MSGSLFLYKEEPSTMLAARSALQSEEAKGRRREHMAETPEIDTDKLRETIEEELERESQGFLRRIALATALLAAVAALASLQAGATANEALLKKTEVARLQGEISDRWAYYQAQRIKAAIQEAARSSWQAAGK